MRENHCRERGQEKSEQKHVNSCDTCVAKKKLALAKSSALYSVD